jgi:hypothetical protein
MFVEVEAAIARGYDYIVVGAPTSASRSSEQLILLTSAFRWWGEFLGCISV